MMLKQTNIAYACSAEPIPETGNRARSEINRAPRRDHDYSAMAPVRRYHAALRHKASKGGLRRWLGRHFCERERRKL